MTWTGRLNVLDLFSGIGGFSLGLERVGMRTVAFCEIDPFCQRVLRKHWPDVPVFGDVRELTAAALAAAEIGRCGEGRPRRSAGVSGLREQAPSPTVDIICGGFPCQDISVAGKGAGIGGERSGLWSQFARIIGEVRPRYVIVENVAALLHRGIERVLGDLAALGFDAEWHCIPASAVGAPHRRDRIWIIAYAPSRAGELQSREWQNLRDKPAINGAARFVADVADATRDVCGEQTARGTERERVGQCGQPFAVANTDSKPTRRLAIAWGECGQWLVEPDVGRVAHGVPARVDRLRSLGNAIVPQIAELIGRAIMMADGK